MPDLNDLLRDLVISNHILAREGVTDALGHVSVRHPDRPDRFFLSCSRSPELVALDDIMEYDLDCNPIDQRGRPMYFERPIHGAVYQARPDVNSVVHNHAYETIPFGLTRKRLQACVHPACGIGTHVGVWDSREAFGDTDLLITNMERGKHLARSMGKDNSILLRGHGCVVVGDSLKVATLNAVYFKINASLVLSSAALGGEINYLSEGEIELTKKLVYSDNAVQRMWDYWARRAA
ncbi:MAG: class II aldolase/adducin family protein [Hyphomicrobiales bacterium]|nr:class II aldolase/adducin family protein [Hyphomicrobiales bacterium]